jgi:hypothetical protein
MYPSDRTSRLVATRTDASSSMMETTGIGDKSNYPSHAMKCLSQLNQLPVEICEHALRFASPILPQLAHDCGNSPERGATFSHHSQAARDRS